MYKFILLLVFSIFIVSCAGDTGKDLCSKDSLDGYCADNKSCVEGECKDLCSKDSLDGYCADNKSCIAGECTDLCSKDSLDGYCADDKSCIEGECKYDMSGIELLLTKNVDGVDTIIAQVSTKVDGTFSIKGEKLEGSYNIEYKDGDTILRKRPGRVKYSNITLKRESGTITTNFDSVFIGKSIEDKVLLDITNIKQFNLDISGKVSIYECIPKKDVGEPVTGAEIYIEQDPSDEPIANGTTSTSDDGTFCFGKDCSGIKIEIAANSTKGGFAVGGFNATKKNSNKKGGFAVGGYRLDKSGKNLGYELSLGNATIKVLDPILTVDKENEFLINKISFDKEVTDNNYAGLIKVNSFLREWNYICE